MAVTPFDRSRALWRRQVVLTALAVGAFVGVAAITRVALSDWGRAPANRAEFLALATVIGVAVVALLLAVCVHALRIARLTFSLSSKNPASETE